METFNEVTALGLTYFLFCFSDFVPDAVARSDLGYYYAALTCLNIAVHLCFMICSTFITLRLHCRRRRFNNALKANKAEE